MFNYKALVRKNAVATRIVLLTVNALGASLYNPNLKDELKKLLIFYSVVLVSWYTLQVPICIYFILDMDSTIPVLMLLVQRLCECVLPILIITQALYQRDALKQTIDHITFVDQSLHSVGLEVDFKKLQHTVEAVFKYITIYSVIYFGSMSFLLVYTIKTAYGLDNYAFLTSTAILSHILYSIYFTYYFCSVVMYFNVRFQHLYKEVESTMSQRDGEIKIIITKIKAIKFAHGVYRGLMNDHNRACDLVITIQFVQSLLIITISIYVLLCIPIVNLINLNSTDICIVFLFLVSICHCFFINVCLTTFCCARAALKANIMEGLIHKLMRKTEETDIRQVLEDFSLELLHERFIFSASDVFIIDYSLFSKIAGAVVSYVVIFLQFGTFDYSKIFYPQNNVTDTTN